MKLGDKAIDFALKGTDGRTHSLKDLHEAKAVVMIFSCNHCPYVKAYEPRMVELQRDFQGKGALFIAINSNDPVQYPEDNFDNMVARAKKAGYNFPYLQDQTQQVARAYGATHTPHLFVFDAQRRLAYTGKIDDNWQDAGAVKRHFLREALEDVTAGKAPRLAETHAIGCTIKWKA